MPRGRSYGGVQGESGVEPESMDRDTGAYGYSARSMGQAMTPNMQAYNQNLEGPKRDAQLMGGTSRDRGNSGGGGGDY